MRIAIAQINSTVGDIDGNAGRILEYIKRARALEADIVVFPELALCGYPPEDLLLKPSFIKENAKKIRQIAAGVKGIAAIIGFPDHKDGSLYNAAAFISNGRIKGIYHKAHLPNYEVFDEKRYFKEGKGAFIFKLNGMTCGINICEDIWHPDGPVRLQTQKGAKMIFVINASPYYAGKINKRVGVIKKQAVANKVSICYTNLVGGQDELVFDGQSLVVNKEGKVIAMAKAFKEDLLMVDTDAGDGPAAILDPLDEIYQALVLGLRDYCSKNGFKKVLIGISGGVDSALVAAIAKDALGEQNTIGVFMPSMFTSRLSRKDADDLAKRLKIKLYTVPISSIYNVYLKELSRIFKNYPKDAAEENIQARIRGNILMAISNKFGYLVLATGNKSEISCGYCTLYGDMAGGFSVIKDVPKTLVYKLARFVVNRKSQVIPKSIINRPPTAELRPNQKDTDSLPPYNVLDPIIESYVVGDKSLQEIVKKGNRRQVVLKVVSMIDRNEYKRRQASPGIKITPKAFGKDRRMPITNKFIEK